MSMPGFFAGASLGQGGRYAGRDGSHAGGVLAASWCLDKCQEANDICQGICSVADAIGGLFGSGGDGGSGGPPRCCPVGTSCRCGGSCETVGGVLQCVKGSCLRADQECP